ncbi:MAG TPA: hypothetical protein EYH30_03125 [Anaerolineales bacterium]|nr:hypothetical protein [Anaerolineales bacterium]
MEEHKAETDRVEENLEIPEPVEEPEPAEETAGETVPPGPTFRQRLATTLAPLGERLEGGLARLRDGLASGNWIYGVITALVVVALILPPISLPQRLGLVGYTRLNADNPSVSHPDGLTVIIGPGAEGNLRVALDSVPQVEFAERAAGPDLQAAAETLPPVLQAKSPYYKIRVGSRADGPATLEVVIPNDAEPWETLDLYTWTGTAWEWLGGSLDLERELLMAQVAHLPSSVVVMQTTPVVPAVGTVATTGPEGQAAEVLTQVLLPGLVLGTDGTLLGEAPAPVGGMESLLLLRNWQDDQPLSPALLADVLDDPDIQQAHIENIVAAAAGYAGATLDYRGVAPEQREPFSAFVVALAEALHNQNIRLEVAVGAPTPAEAGWETGGYDWAALGAAADALLIPFPDDPTAYAEGGQVAALLRWAVGQVNRYKLRAMVSSLSADTSDGGGRHVGLEEALAPFGRIAAPAETTLEPGQEVAFTLTSQVTSILRDEDAGTYAITYQAGDGTAHTVWLGTPSFLARKLDWALRYHLGGVVVTDLTAEGNLPGVLEAVNGYRTAATLTQPAELEVAWRVEGPGASVSEQTVALTQPDFRWTAPPEPGDYTISVAIAGVSRGSVRLTVAEPTPEPAPEPEPLTAEEAACLQAAFEADVTVPDGTHFDNGEAFVKTWRLRNSGTCDWPEATVLAFVSGSRMGGPESVPVGAVPAGEAVEISVDLVAPEESGNFTGRWMLKVGEATIQGGEAWVTIQAGEVTAAPPAPGGGGGFELGGHIRDLNFPYADLMHYAGMNWAKVQVHYGQDASGIIQAAHARGFKIQLSALGSASMVTQPGFEQGFANWVAGLAAAGADAIEVWNEPNIDREWQIGHISPAAYTQLLCTAYNAIKAANPNAIVISAAPAPTGYFGGCGPNGCDDQPWMEGLYNAGAASCMDYIGAHHNAGATSPSARSGHPADQSGHHSWYFLPQTELYYNIFRGTRQLFYTEMGYASQEGVPTFSDMFAWARGNDNSEQAAWLAEAVQLSINTGMVRCIIVWNIDFVRYGYDPQDGYAIVRPGGSCPACDALHAVLGTR